MISSWVIFFFLPSHHNLFRHKGLIPVLISNAQISYSLPIFYLITILDWEGLALFTRDSLCAYWRIIQFFVRKVVTHYFCFSSCLDHFLHQWARTHSSQIFFLLQGQCRVFGFNLNLRKFIFWVYGSFRECRGPQGPRVSRLN